jgi:hypothetical protein
MKRSRIALDWRSDSGTHLHGSHGGLVVSLHAACRTPHPTDTMRAPQRWSGRGVSSPLLGDFFNALNQYPVGKVRERPGEISLRCVQRDTAPLPPGFSALGNNRAATIVGPRLAGRPRDPLYGISLAPHDRNRDSVD